VGFAALRLLEQAGCQVEAPRSQTCCGQPAYNSGDRATARDLARQFLDDFGGFDYVVVPSGSCAGMLKHHLSSLFQDDPESGARAAAISACTFELVSFLVDVLGLTHIPGAACAGAVTYHDSCSGLRELGVKRQPRVLLEAAGIPVVEMADSETCCGFGGTFCVKYPEISVRMVSDKARDIVATNAGTVLAGDVGCLLNIAGRLGREGTSTQVRHIAEVLAGMVDDVAPIGAVKQPRRSA